MIDWKSQVITGPRDVAPRVLVYGVPGVGKSTFASQAPRPIAIDSDRGLEQLGVERIPGPGTWLAALALIGELVDTSGYGTIVIDTIDPLEELATAYVCGEGKKKGLADFEWGAGYEALAQQWRVLLSTLERARPRGMGVVLVGHSVVRAAQDPTLGAFDQFTPQLQKKTWSATARWCDVIGFATVDAAIVGDDRRAIVTGERVLRTSRGTGYEAKNRYALPDSLPLVWSALAAGMAAHGRPADTAETVRARIHSLASGTEYQAKAEDFVAAAGDDVGKLIGVEAALKARVGR